MGVVGKDGTRLIAKGDVFAKFIQNSKIEAGGNVVVADSIINCDVLSYNTIEVQGKMENYRRKIGSAIRN
jgi:uncharacterized protein (DUF342 family)